MNVTVGDALNVLPTIADGTYDAVIADPPYSTGGAMRVDRNLPTAAKYQRSDAAQLPNFVGDSRGQLAHMMWSRLWMGEAWRVVKPGGWLMVFTDWRQLAATVTAVEMAGWVTRGIVVWVKPSPRPAPNRFSQSCEFVVTGTKGQTANYVIDEATQYPAGVWTGSAPTDRVHMTQKPVELIRHLMRVVPPGGSVLDPFLGSGTTLEAGQLSGIHVDGVDISDEWMDWATARVAQLPLFADGAT